MPPKRKVETVEDKTKAPPAKKTGEEKPPTISPDQGADGETATLALLAEVDETPNNFKTTDRDGKLKWRTALIVEFDKIAAEARVNNDNEERKGKK